MSTARDSVNSNFDLEVEVPFSPVPSSPPSKMRRVDITTSDQLPKFLDGFTEDAVVLNYQNASLCPSSLLEMEFYSSTSASENRVNAEVNKNEVPAAAVQHDISEYSNIGDCISDVGTNSETQADTSTSIETNPENDSNPSYLIIRIPSPKVGSSVANDESKTDEILLQEYIKCPANRKKLEKFIREHIQDYLRANQEDIKNAEASNLVIHKFDQADCSTMMIKLLCSEANANAHSGPGDNAQSEVSENAHSKAGDNSHFGVGDNVHSDAGENSNVGAGDNVNFGAGDNTHSGAVDNASSIAVLNPVASVNIETDWRAKITKELFTKLNAAMNVKVRCSREDKIKGMGKVVFPTLFLEKEIVGGFARKRKGAPAYDETKVFEMHRIINFMLTEATMPASDAAGGVDDDGDFLLEKYRSQINRPGLEKNDRETFKQAVLSKYACDIRNGRYKYP